MTVEHYSSLTILIYLIISDYTISEIRYAPRHFEKLPSTTRLSVVSVPVLSKQHISTLPANGMRNGSVQNTPKMSIGTNILDNEKFFKDMAQANKSYQVSATPSMNYLQQVTTL